MGRLEEVQKEERGLLEKGETLSDGMKQLTRIKEEYEQQFQEASRFFTRLEFQFQKSNDRHFFENTTELHNEKRAVERKIDELAYEKKRLAMEEDKNER